MVVVERWGFFSKTLVYCLRSNCWCLHVPRFLLRSVLFFWDWFDVGFDYGCCLHGSRGSKILILFVLLFINLFGLGFWVSLCMLHVARLVCWLLILLLMDGVIMLCKLQLCCMGVIIHVDVIVSWKLGFLEPFVYGCVQVWLTWIVARVVRFTPHDHLCMDYQSCLVSISYLMDYMIGFIHVVDVS